MRWTVAAPGKLNLCLQLGPPRDDGFHELLSLFESVSLADVLTVEQAAADSVQCPGVEGENLAARALRAARESGLWTGPHLAVRITKHVPVAAGMGGGSADAAAMLRLVARLEDRRLEDFCELAFTLGADVPSQLRPGAALVRGAGERVAPVDPRCLERAARAYVIVAQADGLSTAEVFAQADRAALCDPKLGDPELGDPELGDPEFAGHEDQLVETLAGGVDLNGLCALVDNALEPAILALRPELSSLPNLLRQAGALAAAFTGSGPTCFGIFASFTAAEAAAEELTAAGHHAWTAEPVGERFARPREEVPAS